MNWKRFGHILVCLVLICALLVSISPIRAHAEGVLLTAAASMIILGAAGAMGVHFTNATVYDSFYNAALVNEQINRFFTTMGDGVAQLGYYVLEGVAYLSADFLVALGDFFYDSGTLVAPYNFITAGTSVTMLNGTVLTPSADCVHIICFYYGGKRVLELFYLPNGGTIYNESKGSDEGLSYASIDSVRHYYYSMDYSGSNISEKAEQATVVWNDYYDSKLSKDLISAYLAGTLGTVVAGLEDIELGEQVVQPGYDEEKLQQSVWYSPHAWLNPGLSEDEDEMYAPVLIPGEFEDTLGLTQEEFQIGEILVEDTGVDTGTGSGGVEGDDYLSEKVAALRFRFVFADSIMGTIEYLSNRLRGLGTEPPVVYVDLGAAEGSYNYGEKFAFVDLSWYEDYKPVGDAIISTFLWWLFMWKLYVKLPGIINGLPGDWIHSSADNIGVSGSSSTSTKSGSGKQAASSRSGRSKKS